MAITKRATKGSALTHAEMDANIDEISTRSTATTFNADTSHPDNVKAKFGGGNDLEIYHESSTNNSRIVESGTGNLNIEASNLNLKTPTGENYINCNENAAVDLRYDNVTKLSTTSTGVDVTGAVGAKGSLTAHQTNAGIMQYSTNQTAFRSYGATAGSGWMSFQVGGGGGSADSEAMRIDSSGNVGVNSTPENWASAYTALQVGSQFNVNHRTSDNASAVGFNHYNDGAWKRQQAYGAAMIQHYNGALNFEVAPSGAADSTISWTTAMKIDNSGRAMIGTTATIGPSNLSIKQETSAWSCLGLQNTGGASTSFVNFVNSSNTAIIGSIKNNGNTSTSYNTTSDYRLKENVVPMSGSIDRVKQLKPCNFNFIADATTTVDGFLAHEAQAVVPESVTGDKDAMRTEEYEVTPAVEATYDEDGNELTPAVEAVMGTREVEDYQGIDQSKLVPLLTSALQEAVAKIEALEARVTALESA